MSTASLHKHRRAHRPDAGHKVNSLVPAPLSVPHVQGCVRVLKGQVQSLCQGQLVSLHQHLRLCCVQVLHAQSHAEPEWLSMCSTCMQAGADSQASHIHLLARQSPKLRCKLLLSPEHQPQVRVRVKVHVSYHQQAAYTMCLYLHLLRRQAQLQGCTARCSPVSSVKPHAHSLGTLAAATVEGISRLQLPCSSAALGQKTSLQAGLPCLLRHVQSVLKATASLLTAATARLVACCPAALRQQTSWLDQPASCSTELQKQLLCKRSKLCLQVESQTLCLERQNPPQLHLFSAPVKPSRPSTQRHTALHA